MIVLASPAANQIVPGILGFLVVAGMSLALFFLLRSMNKQLRKVVPEPQWKQAARRFGPRPQARGDGFRQGGGASS